MKLTAAAFAEATSMKKWDAERQQDCDEALETIRRAKTEDDEYQQWRIRRVRGSRDRGTSRLLENPISPSNRLFSRSSREDTTSVRGHPDRHSSASGQKALGADTPRAGANPPPRVKRQATGRNWQVQPSHRACSLTLSSAHLTPEQVAKWVAHQRVQREAGTFDARTLTTTISERCARTLPATGERSGPWTRSSKR